MKVWSLLVAWILSVLSVVLVAACAPSPGSDATKLPPHLTSTEKEALRTTILSYFRTLPPADLEISVDDLGGDAPYRTVLSRQKPVAIHTCSSGFGRCSVFELGRFWTDGETIDSHFDVGNIDSGPSSERFNFVYFFRPNSLGQVLIRRGLLFTHAASTKCPATVNGGTAMVGTVSLTYTASAPRDFSLADVGLSGPLETAKEAREPGEICGRDLLRSPRARSIASADSEALIVSTLGLAAARLPAGEMDDDGFLGECQRLRRGNALALAPRNIR